jgi:hypothetical protein
VGGNSDRDSDSERSERAKSGGRLYGLARKKASKEGKPAHLKEHTMKLQDPIVVILQHVPAKNTIEL